MRSILQRRKGHDAGDARKPVRRIAKHRYTEISPEVLEHCLLSMVCGRPRYGFKMIRKLDEHGLRLTGKGSIYPRLCRLVRSGFLDYFMSEVGQNGRRRKYYRLTGDGARALERLDGERQPSEDGVGRLLAGRGTE